MDTTKRDPMEFCTFTSPPTVREYLERGEALVGEHITVTGRLARVRDQRKFVFGELGDGTESAGLQFIYHFPESDDPDDRSGVPAGILDMIERAKTGSSVTLSGTVVKAPERATQLVELVLDDATVISIVRDPDAYPYGRSAMKRRTPEVWAEYLKSIRPDVYRRFRHKIMAAIMRIRGEAAAELVLFFRRLGFFKADSPLFTKSDCEGAGEMFQVTTLPLDDVPKTKDGHVDYSKDFFGCEAHLTVSGQLEAEALAQVLGKVFTFGPTFRAEHSQTSRHLSEFWMLEPELQFTEGDVEARFHRLMDLEESMVKCVIAHLLDKCRGDLEFLDSKISPGLVDRLTAVRDSPFGRVPYTECIDILQTAVADGHEFEDTDIFWGMDLASEHERYLCETVFAKPMFVTHYPQDLKSFYMKADDGCEADRVTCQAVDLLVPGIGELCGGSMREDDPDKLVAVMHKKGVPTEDLQWYIDLRYDGGIPTGGFGLGFTRFVAFVTGATSVRDCIPWPKYYTHI